ncbi:hypothetical protein FGO68_gene1512 [Halteria grandinella]|uniref:Uncharacterized protein n=1 Tax=Halteria grandinella TaxID=5974 RepID=A0A8J8NIU8_HALGN|nr:hypothetical protein FGO68_gene1512 [Halteria grandinella]
MSIYSFTKFNSPPHIVNAPQIHNPGVGADNKFEQLLEQHQAQSESGDNQIHNANIVGHDGGNINQQDSSPLIGVGGPGAAIHAQNLPDPQGLAQQNALQNNYPGSVSTTPVLPSFPGVITGRQALATLLGLTHDQLRALPLAPLLELLRRLLEIGFEKQRVQQPRGE